MINSLFGGLLLYLINLVGGLFGFHIGLNLFTCIFVGILGVPGAILLILVRIVFGF